MANSFGLLLLAVVVAFICAQLMKDAKAFSRFMIILLLGLIVGAGVKAITKKLAPEKAEVVSTEVTPMPVSTTPFVVESTIANLELVGKEIVTRDRVETESEGLPTSILVKEYQDDS